MWIHLICYKNNMSLLTVLTYPNKRLRDKSKPIEKVSADTQKLAKDMLETMYTEHGIGLAAPQIGELIRLIVLDVPIPDPLDPENPEKTKSDAIALINPVVKEGSGLI